MTRVSEAVAQPGSFPLEARALGRRFGPVLALDGLTFRLSPGEVLGLVGLNGAGKSTTLRLAAGLLKPGAGEILLDGEPARRALAARRGLGYLPGEPAYTEESTGSAWLDFLAALGGGDPSRRASRRRELAGRLGLTTSDLGRPLGTMSHGMRQKVGLLQALEHDPRLLLLDEPSDGLDPLARMALLDILQECRARGCAILLASHVLSEIERSADRIAVLHRGRLVALETRESLRRRKAVCVTASFDGPTPSLEGRPEIDVLEAGPGRLSVRMRPPLDPLVKALAATSVRELSVREPDLEDLLSDLAGGSAP
jgi:ABC-2 type transport system ATP-binding protein